VGGNESVEGVAGDTDGGLVFRGHT
jgi:hypothetical protein